MGVSYIPEKQKDIFRDFQFLKSSNVVTTPQNFGEGFGTDPVFKFPGVNLRFDFEMNPEKHPIQTLSDDNRTKLLVIKKSAGIPYFFELTDVTYNGILADLLTPSKTAFQPWAGFFSKKPGSTEWIRSAYGIVPGSSTLNIPANGEPVNMMGNLVACKPQALSNTPITIGAGSFAPAITTSPLLPKEAGTNPFKYDNVVYETGGMSITVEPVYNIVDPDESEFVELMIPVSYLISGTVSIFKKKDDNLFETDIENGNLKTMSRVLKPFINPTNGVRIDLTDVELSKNHVDNYKEIQSNSNKRTFNFTAGGISLVNLTS